MWKELPITDLKVIQAVLRNSNVLELFAETGDTLHDLSPEGLSANAQFTDFLTDRFLELRKIVRDYTAHGDAGDFCVSISFWGGLYIVEAPEFDDRGYFVNLKDAMFAAEDIIENFS
jgi:hypothetical protein